jgi:lysophospholipase L1-like esterase
MQGPVTDPASEPAVVAMRPRRTRRGRVIAGRLLLLALGSTLLPLLLIEAALRVGVWFRPNVGPAPPTAGTRVVCIGDSNTFGVYFPRTASYPARLEAVLDGVSGADQWCVIQAGRPGRSTGDVLRSLPELLERLTPSYVLVLAGINDRWNHPEQDGAVTRFLADHFRVFTVARMIATQQSFERLDEERADPARVADFSLNLGETELRELIRDHLMQIAQLVRAAGATPVFLTYPAPEPPFLTPNAAIRDAAADASVTLIEIDRLFVSQLAHRAYDELLVPRDFHPKPAGYELMARAAARSLLTLTDGDPSAADTLAIAPPSPTITLTMAATPPGLLQVRGPPRRRFRVYISGTRTPVVQMLEVRLPIGADELFGSVMRLPLLAGETDEQGEATIALPPDELAKTPSGPAGLLATAVLLRPGACASDDPALWAEDCSAALELRAPK